VQKSAAHFLMPKADVVVHDGGRQLLSCPVPLPRLPVARQRGAAWQDPLLKDESLVQGSLSFKLNPLQSVQL
jgi:hypothetical protein